MSRTPRRHRPQKHGVRLILPVAPETSLLAAVAEESYPPHSVFHQPDEPYCRSTHLGQWAVSLDERTAMTVALDEDRGSQAPDWQAFCAPASSLAEAQRQAEQGRAIEELLRIGRCALCHHGFTVRQTSQPETEQPGPPTL